MYFKIVLVHEVDRHFGKYYTILVCLERKNKTTYPLLSVARHRFSLVNTSIIKPKQLYAIINWQTVMIWNLLNSFSFSIEIINKYCLKHRIIRTLVHFEVQYERNYSKAQSVEFSHTKCICCQRLTGDPVL